MFWILGNTSKSKLERPTGTSRSKQSRQCKPQTKTPINCSPKALNATSSRTVTSAAVARGQACLQANGTACAICGFDFAKAYGPEFAGIIQVHHITPISEIGHEYQVDPVHDLIPVCPNCHVALHLKPGGTYTPDELRALLRRAENDEKKER